MKIIINANDVSREENKLWRGLGMVSGNNSSRLLIDYKALHPDKYLELLNLMFGKEGLNIGHLKIEMGADINSSSGTEPCTMRVADQVADVTRGAGFVLAADAKKINPDLTLDMLWWGEPKWIEDCGDDGPAGAGDLPGGEGDLPAGAGDFAEGAGNCPGGAENVPAGAENHTGGLATQKKNLYEARYSWYKGNLVQAYKVFGLKFDFVSATQNERGWDPEWIKFLSAKLKNEKNCPYDFSKIKIVAGEEVCTWNQADLMLNDQDLLNAVDVIGSHYTSWSNENVWKLRELGKEIWFSEGSSPMGYSKNLYKYDGNGSGLGGLNGVLDVANRFITMYPGGKMTLCEFQPVVAAYYDGVTYCHKQFISASSPWSGFYELDPGFFMMLHFSQFIKKGWAMVDQACYGDGKPAGDGHALAGAKYSYLTSLDLQTGDLSCVITNTTENEIEYQLELENVDLAKNFYLYETSGVTKDKILKKFDLGCGKKELSIKIKPNSIVTISTINKNPMEDLKENINSRLEENFNLPENFGQVGDYGQAGKSDQESGANQILKLPYCDDFSYPDFADDFLEKRGNAPLFMTDEGGAFEIEKGPEKNVLRQQIAKADRAKEWGYTPDPVTNFGDDRWFNYSVEINGSFEVAENKAENYIGLGLRYNLPDSGKNGYWLQLFENGEWKFNRNDKCVRSGKIAVGEKSPGGRENPSGGENQDDVAGKILPGEKKLCGAGKITPDGLAPKSQLTEWNKMKIQVEDDRISAWINDVLVLDELAGNLGITMQGGGRAAIFSSYNKNSFADLKVLPVGQNPYIRRYDCLDDCFEYIQDQNSKWDFGLMESFKQYKRTVVKGGENSLCKLNFEGTRFLITGSAGEMASVEISVDGKIYDKEYRVLEAGNREALVFVNGLENKKHEAGIKILKGKLNIDAVEF